MKSKTIETVAAATFACVREIDLYKSSPRDYGNGDLLFLSETHLIELIGKTPGIQSIEIAKLNGITKSAVSQTLKKLTVKGYVVKRQKPDNKKDAPLYLTEAGQHLFEVHQAFDDAGRMALTAALEAYTLEELHAYIQVTHSIRQVFAAYNQE